MLRAKDIKLLQEWGKENKVVRNLMKSDRVQPRIFETNYYHPSNANWSWQVGIAKIGNKYYELLTRFGSIEGGREIYLPEYTLDKLTIKEG